VKELYTYINGYVFSLFPHCSLYILMFLYCKNNLFNFLYCSMFSTKDGPKITKVSESEIIPPLEEINGQ
jgi:hypothetical protein